MRTLRLLLVAWLAADASARAAQEIIFREHNCAITLPEGWDSRPNRDTNPKILGTYGPKGPNPRVVFMIAPNLPPRTILNGPFLAGYEFGMNRTGQTRKIAGKYFKVGDVKGYERIGTQTINGREISTRIHLFIADGKLYQLMGLDSESDAATDAGIDQCLASFRFLTAPKDGGNDPVAGRSTPYRIGYYAGLYFRYALLAGAVAVIIAVILIRRGRSQRPAPPPLPPRPMG